MSELGMGVMLRQMFGDTLRHTEAGFNSALNRIIQTAEITEDTLILTFTDGAVLRISDGGQSCCEYRHMSTDDDLSTFSGAQLLNIELRDGPDMWRGDEYHETQFLRIETTNGPLVIVNHNEHNGFYGGFSIECSFEYSLENKGETENA